MNGDNINKGISFPLKFNSHGGTKTAQLNEKIRQSIYIILATERGERVMRPNFGGNLKSLLFAPNNTGTANIARFYVEEALNTWEPRIVLEEVSVQNNNDIGELLITIRYRIKATNESSETTIPFNLQQL